MPFSLHLKRWGTALMMGTMLSVSAPGLVGHSGAAIGHPVNSADEKPMLGPVTAFAREKVRSGQVGHMVVMVSQNDHLVHQSVHGDVKLDTIFRIYSMTKPITTAAAMMLVEEGKIGLDDPVSRYIPSFSDQQVFVAEDVETGALETRPANRPATIRDLMRHTSGLTYGVFGDTPVDRAYRAAGFGPTTGGDKMMETLGGMPLLADPGAIWIYGFNTDVLGHIVAQVSGTSLEAVMRQRLFEPLGMEDTAFHVPAEKLARFAPLYVRTQEGGVALSDAEAFGEDFTKPPVFMSGGGGLVSTIQDYMLFARMIENEGSLNGVQYLKPETVAMMRSDQLAEADHGGLGKGVGMGFGFGVVVDPAKVSYPVNAGDFFWGGHANTTFFIDPSKDLVAVMMTNLLAPGLTPYREELRAAILPALQEAHTH